MDQWLEAGRRPHSRAGRRLTQTALQQRQEPCPPRGTALVCARPLKRLSQDAQPAGPGEKLPAGSRYGAVVGFESAYRDGEPPWDIGRAQPAFARLAEEGAIAGSVVDVGCGTGENALYFASLGHDVTGIDAAPTAIARARGKAAERAIRVTFLEADAIDVGGVTRTFDNAIDSGARSVDVYLEGGGLTRVRVVDDGAGMGSDDLALCGQPHATSKIETEDDLLRATSLGFRGEALSSIAAVANLSILSRREDEKFGNWLVKCGYMEELSMAMALLGAASLDALTPDLLVRR